MIVAYICINTFIYENKKEFVNFKNFIIARKLSELNVNKKCSKLNVFPHWLSLCICQITVNYFLSLVVVRTEQL